MAALAVGVETTRRNPAAASERPQPQETIGTMATVPADQLQVLIEHAFSPDANVRKPGK